MNMEIPDAGMTKDKPVLEIISEHTELSTTDFANYKTSLLKPVDEMLCTEVTDKRPFPKPLDKVPEEMSNSGNAGEKEMNSIHVNITCDRERTQKHTDEEYSEMSSSNTISEEGSVPKYTDGKYNEISSTSTVDDRGMVIKHSDEKHSDLSGTEMIADEKMPLKISDEKENEMCTAEMKDGNTTAQNAVDKNEDKISSADVKNARVPLLPDRLQDEMSSTDVSEEEEASNSSKVDVLNNEGCFYIGERSDQKSDSASINTTVRVTTEPSPIKKVSNVDSSISSDIHIPFTAGASDVRQNTVEEDKKVQNLEIKKILNSPNQSVSGIEKKKEELKGGSTSSRRNKAFKMKLNFKKCNYSDSESESDDDNYWFIDRTEKKQDLGQSLMGHSENSFSESLGVTDESNQDLYSHNDDVAMFIEGSGKKTEIRSVRDTVINEQEVAASALKYFENITSAVNMLSNQSAPPVKAPVLPAKKKTVWKEKNIKIIDNKKWRECNKCAKLFKTRREMREHNKTHRDDPISEPDLRIIDGKRWRECSLCKKLFHTRKELRIHFRTHTNEKPYECDVCGKGFKQLAHMNSHMKIHSGEKPHTCDMCGMNFSERSSLKRHIRRHLGIKPHKCTMCPNEYYTSTLLKSHMESHMIKNGDLEKFECSICFKGYSRKETLNVHMKTHDPEKSIKCEICETVFLTQSHLRRHQLTHQDNVERNFVCGECKKAFKTKVMLKSHMLIHTATREYKCDQCDWAFKDKHTLKRHKVTHDPQKDDYRIHKCTECDKGFFSRGNLTEHLKTHTNDRPFECEICFKTFKRKSELANHIQNHQIKPHKCHLCTKSYACFKGLRQHLDRFHNVHGAEPGEESDKIYSCDQCDKSFRIKSSLQSHIKIHSKEAPTCEICGKVFNKQSSLKHHLISHTTERNRQCHLCPKNFKFLANLRRHLIDVHNLVIGSRRSFKCPLCDNNFGLKESFVKHIEKYHGIEDQAVIDNYLENIEQMPNMTLSDETVNTGDDMSNLDVPQELPLTSHSETSDGYLQMEELPWTLEEGSTDLKSDPKPTSMMLEVSKNNGNVMGDSSDTEISDVNEPDAEMEEVNLQDAEMEEEDVEKEKEDETKME